MHSPSTPSLDEDQGGKRFISVAINSKLTTLRKTNNYTVSKTILYIQEYLTLMLSLRLELQ